MIEIGQRPLDRRSHIAAVARALRISETDLVGGPRPLRRSLHGGLYAHTRQPLMRGWAGAGRQGSRRDTVMVSVAVPLPEL